MIVLQKGRRIKPTTCVRLTRIICLEARKDAEHSNSSLPKDLDSFLIPYVGYESNVFQLVRVQKGKNF